jgi:hypothetical protein
MGHSLKFREYFSLEYLDFRCKKTIKIIKLVRFRQPQADKWIPHFHQLAFDLVSLINLSRNLGDTNFFSEFRQRIPPTSDLIFEVCYKFLRNF